MVWGILYMSHEANPTFVGSRKYVYGIVVIQVPSFSM